MRRGNARARVPCIAQRQVAAPVTDPSDPKYLTAQTRKMGGPMPAEQMALVFDHLDLALKVFPDDKRIEGVDDAAASRPRRRSDTLILDFFPKFTISEIDLDGKPIAPSAYSNPEGQLRITLATPLAGRREVRGARRLCGDAAARQASAMGRRHDVDENARRQVSLDRYLAVGRRVRPALPVPRSSDAEAGDIRSPLHRARGADGAGQRRAGQQDRQRRLDDVELARAQRPHLRLGARCRAVQGDGRRLQEPFRQHDPHALLLSPGRGDSRPPSCSPNSRRRSISGRT